MIQNYLLVEAEYTADALKQAERIFKDFAPVDTGNLRAHGIKVVPLGANGVQVRVENTAKVPYAVYPNFRSKKNAGWEQKASSQFTKYLRAKTGKSMADTYTYEQGDIASIQNEMRTQAQQMTEIQSKLDKLMKIVNQIGGELDEVRTEKLKKELVTIFMNIDTANGSAQMFSNFFR